MDPKNPLNDETLARLSDYLDGGLDPVDRAALERELAADADLRKELAALARVDELIRGQGGRIPELDWDRFSATARMRREAALAPRKRPLIFRIYRPLAAAAALGVVVTAFLLMRSESPQAVVTTTPHGAAVAVVTIERAAAASHEADRRVEVNISHDLPPDVVATVGPVPRGRTLIVSVGGDAAGEIERFGEDEAGLF